MCKGIAGLVAKVGIRAVATSASIPIVGVILYFVKKEKVQDPQTYLKAAAVGFAIGIVLRFIL